MSAVPHGVHCMATNSDRISGLKLASYFSLFFPLSISRVHTAPQRVQTEKDFNKSMELHNVCAKTRT